MVYIAKSAYMQEVLEVLNSARLASVPTILWGPPGTGKTSLIEALGERYGLVVKILLGSIMDPTDLSGLPAIQNRVDEDGIPYQVTKNTVPDWADDLIKAGGGILLLDELNNSTPTMQSAFLSLLQGHKVGQYVLPKDVWIIAASNEEKDAADGYTFAPPMGNRLLHIDWKPESKDWLIGMQEQWGNQEEVPGIAEWRFSFVRFLRNYGDLIQQQPKDEEKAGKAWPSRRSWDNAAKTLGSRNMSDNAQLLALKGLVGEAAATQYFKWVGENLLPTPEQVLSNPEAINWRALKGDAAYTIIERMKFLVDEKNLNDTLNVHIVALNNGRKDIVLSCATDLMEIVKKKGLMSQARAEGSKLTEYVKLIAQFSGKSGLGHGNTKRLASR
jgi:hypothetical protein